MSRCHPYPPPGYVKKAATELLGEALPAAQVAATSGEKQHKHRDKDKKKKRKREDKEKDENNGHKDKRSHKTKKPAHGNDVGGGVHTVANGKLEAVDNRSLVVPHSSSGGEKDTVKLPSSSHDRVSLQQLDAGKGNDRLSGSSQISSYDEARTSCTPGKSSLQPADREITGYQEPRSSKTRMAEPRAGFQEARSSSSTVKTASLKSDRPRESSHGVDGNLKPIERTGAVAGTSASRIVLPKEINGKVPSVLVKPFDTGQSEQQEPRPEQEERNLQKNQNHHQHQQKDQQQDQQQHQEQKSSDQKEKLKDDQKKKSSEKEKEKRHRLPEIKLPEIKEENLEEDDAYLEWLYPSKRRPLEKPKAEKEEDVGEVWAEALYIPSINSYALPYVVPL